MYKLRKQVACWVMVVSILCGSFTSCVTVRADFMGMTWEEFVDMYQYGLTSTKYMLTSVFGFFTQDLDTYIQNNQEYWQYAVDFQNRWSDKDQASVDVSKEELQSLYDITKDCMTALNNYYLVTSNLDRDAYYNSVGSALSDSYVTSFMNFYNSLGDNFFVRTSTKYNSIYDFDLGYYYYLSGKYIVRYSISSGNSNSSFVNRYGLLTYYSDPLHYTNFELRSNRNDSLSYENLSYCGSPFKLFYSLFDLKNYLNGRVDVYTGSNFQMPVLSGNKLNLDLSKASEKDWDKVNKSVYDAVSDAIADAGGLGNLSQEDTQKIIDDKITDIIGSLDEIGDNTGQSNVLLSSIKDYLNKIASDVEHISSNLMVHINAVSGKLKDIIDGMGPMSSNLTLTSKYLYEINNKLNTMQDKLYELISTLFKGFDFQELLDTIKTSGGGGGSAAGSAVGTIIGNLISDLLDSILNGDEAIEDAVSSLTSKFTKLVDTSKTKFPFSLPWDVILIFETLSHAPETPVVDFPIKVPSVGFDYTIHVDMKDFESLSKMCRAFFAITFALILIKLTLLMINRGDLDA